MVSISNSASLQLILNPIRDWNKQKRGEKYDERMLQLILNPIRDWNSPGRISKKTSTPMLQLILNPIRDWNTSDTLITDKKVSSN